MGPKRNGNPDQTKVDLKEVLVQSQNFFYKAKKCATLCNDFLCVEGIKNRNLTCQI